MSWFPCPCYSSWKARLVRWFCEEWTRLRRGKQKEMSHWLLSWDKGVTERVLRSYRSKLWALHAEKIGEPGDFFKNVCKCWRLQAAMSPSVFVSLKKQWPFLLKKVQRIALDACTYMQSLLKEPSAKLYQKGVSLWAVQANSHSALVLR